jgi:chromosome segregation ATPase
MAALIVLVLLAQEPANILTYLSTAVSLLLGGALIRLVTLRSTARSAAAKATVDEANIERADVEIDELRQKLTTQVLESVNAELGRYREQVAEERSRAAAAIQGQAFAQSELARVQLQLAEALEQASKERHALRNEIAALGARNAALELEMAEMKARHSREVRELRAELESLRAAQDSDRHGRRRNDGADG